MTRTALRAEAGRTGRDPLGAAAAVAARAAAAGRSLSLFERAQARALVRDHEAAIGRSLLAEAEAIAARQHDGQLADRARAALALRLDVLEALAG
jgi:hypothetical protein